MALAADTTTPALQVEVVSAIDRVPAAAWNNLVPPDDPFTRHEFLSVLEECGAVSAEAGWQPAHLLVRQGGALVAAAPLYVKDHSYGEYVFDWGWAEASERAGLPYYPKLVCAVPFTPVGGQRFLVAPGLDAGPLRRALLAGMREVADATGASSLHVLFPTKEEHTDLSPVLLGRLGFQFHWENEGYADFEDWLSHFRHKERKEARRERRHGAHVQVVEDLDAGHWAALHAFYRDTTGRKWGQAYLPPAFFELAPRRLGHLAVGVMAEHEGRIVAGALCFRSGSRLFGRYWGSHPDHRHLHFDVCYHQPVALCIERGWSRFEAGAQGMHKLKRGLMPAPTWSLHWLRHRGLARAVGEFVGREAVAVGGQIVEMAAHGPFRRE